MRREGRGPDTQAAFLRTGLDHATASAQVPLKGEEIAVNNP